MYTVKSAGGRTVGGRRPLRGPFGQMLNESMRQSDTRRERMHQLLGDADTIAFIQGLRASNAEAVAVAAAGNMEMGYEHNIHHVFNTYTLYFLIFNYSSYIT